MTALKNLPLASWDGPPKIAARATLIVIPGRGESPALYERLGTRLAFDAYRVRAVADPTRDPDGVREQILALLDDETLPAPRVLIGSDAGALFAASLVASGAVAVDGLVLAGLLVEESAADKPTRDGETPDWERELSARTACPTHQARLSADETLLRGAIEQPVPSGWFAAADLARVQIPVLGVHGADDAISPVSAASARYAGAAHASLVQISGGRHDALNDATHRTVAATIVLFLERLRLGADLPVIAETLPTHPETGR